MVPLKFEKLNFFFFWSQVSSNLATFFHPKCCWFIIHLFPVWKVIKHGSSRWTGPRKGSPMSVFVMLQAHPPTSHPQQLGHPPARRTPCTWTAWSTAARLACCDPRCSAWFCSASRGTPALWTTGWPQRAWRGRYQLLPLFGGPQQGSKIKKKSNPETT